MTTYLDGLPVSPEPAPDADMLTFSGRLLVVAKWLKLADRAMELVAEARGRNLLMGDDVQRDLEHLAAWLKARPEIDRMLLEAMTGLSPNAVAPDTIADIIFP